MYEKASDVEANKVEVYEAAKYDLYILPDGELKAKYTDAAYIGFYEIDKLKFEELKDAFIVGKDEEGAFTLTVDKDVYADEFGAILATTGDTFTVTIAEKAESSIDGLPGNPFKFAIPTAEPTALEAINLHFDGILYIVIGQTKDLNDYIKAKNKDAAIDFKSFISYSSDEPEKLAIEGSILTAVDKWNGEVTATYTKGSKTIKVTFPVKAVESEDRIPTPPTSVESIVKGGKSVVFAGGELILKGFGGSIATVYGLNGGVVASFAVGSDDASFGLGLGKGFYLVKAGSTVTKFIVK
jgi:hypothetical protein